MKPELRLFSITELTHSLHDLDSDMREEEVLYWLRDRGYLVSNRGERFNTPSDLALELGYLVHERTCVEGSGGGVIITLKPMLTQAGWEYIFPKLKRFSDTRHDIRD